MSFTMESKKQNRMPFLNVPIIREDKTFTSSVYCKPTFSGAYTDCDRFLPSMSLVLSTHSLIDACESAQLGLNYTIN